MSYRRAALVHKIPSCATAGALALFAFACISASCQKPAESKSAADHDHLVVFNAGSLTASFAEMLDEFKRLHPGMTAQQESSGSLEAARKITDLGKHCDLLAVADFDVIPALLIPQYAEWYAVFARNQMVLAYTPKSKFSAEINDKNWSEILLRQGVEYGHSDPDQDPAGYRTLLHWQLAEKYYSRPGLYRQLQDRMPAKNVRPKSVELVALLQSGELDYIYEYRSVAEQNKLSFLVFPPDIDLSDPAKADFYANASVEVAGNKPGDKIKIQGMPILLGLTIPKTAQNNSAAEQFVAFIFAAEGQAVMKRYFLIAVSPPLASDVSRLPAALRDKVVLFKEPTAARPTG